LLSAFFNGFQIFLNGFPIFLNDFPLSEKSKKIYLRRLGEATFSPLTRGVNANDSSLGPSIGMSSYDDATIGDNTVSQETNDELI
jgi:hypothetical protein